MPPRSRYRGESNAYDTANNKVYLGDLLYSFPLGSDLTGWTLAGNTVPTIASDGQIDLFDNINLANQTSEGYVTIPNTKGAFLGIFHCKFTKQADDTSGSNVQFLAMLNQSGAPVTGIGYQYDSAIITLHWKGQVGFGTTRVLGAGVGVPVASREFALDMLFTPSYIVYLLDSVLLGTIPVGEIGNSPLPDAQTKSWFANDKRVYFQVRHNAGQVSHYRVRDIRVSRLVGTSV